MNILSPDHKLHYLQDAWNQLDPETALTYSQYDLAKETPYTIEEWAAFLKDGQVAKYLDDEIELYKQAQMRKLIQKATLNDKSVGTAQMLNAIGKTMDDDQVEQNFFIYSYVPPTANEGHSNLVRQEDNWRPPEHIDLSAEDESVAVAEPEQTQPVVAATVEEPTTEVSESDWEF